jgi:hypothetical protein
MLSFEETLERRKAGKWSWAWLRSLRSIFWSSRSTGYTVLPGSDFLELDEIHLGASSQAGRHQSDSSWNVPEELAEHVRHYCRMGPGSSWPTNKLLWIMAETQERCDSITSKIWDDLESQAALVRGIAVEVDVSATHSVFWPLVCALAKALPAYREAIARDPPCWFARMLQREDWRDTPSSPTSPYDFPGEELNLTVRRTLYRLMLIPKSLSTGDRERINL